MAGNAVSAIAGIAHARTGQATAPDFSAMRLALAHRGPDGSACWASGSVGFVHLLHRTLSETGPQPLSIGPLTITADVRLDNRQELLRELDADRTVAEEELVLLAYRRWGANCPARLRGDFAFAIWDSADRRLLLARDHFGVRQLHYWERAGTVAFSTEIRGLRALPWITTSVDESRVAAMARFDLSDPEATLYQGIRRLPPASSLEVTPGSVRLSRYWSPEDAPEVRLPSSAEYAEAYRELFTRSVAARMRGPARIGSTLSGGLDSTSVACVARDLLGERGALPLPVFSARYRVAAASDESQFIDAALAGDGFEGLTVEPERWGPLSDWEDAQEGADEPLFNPQMALHWALYEGAAAAGVSVLLDGYGGDSVVSHGAGRLTELAASGHLLDALGQARALAREAGEPLLPLLRRHVVAPLAPTAVRHLWRLLRRRQGLKVAPPRSERAAHVAELLFGNHAFALGIADRAAARHQVEPRYPFLEPQLAEFCLGLPAKEKLDGGLSRNVARRGLIFTLPPLIATRGGKGNLGPAFELGMRDLGTKSDPIRRWSESVLTRWRGRVVPRPPELEVWNACEQ